MIQHKNVTVYTNNMTSKIKLSTVRKALLIGIVLIVPNVLIYTLSSPHLAIAFTLSAVVGIKSSSVTGLRQSSVLALMLSALLSLAVLIGTNELLLTLLVTVAGLITIYTNRISTGLFSLAPVYVAISAFLIKDASPLAVLIASLSGYAYATAMVYLAKIKLKAKPMPRKPALMYGLLLTITAALSTYICLTLSVPHAYWLVLTSVLVLKPQHSLAFSVMWRRILATALGGALAIVVLLLPSPLVIIIAIITAVMFLCYLLINNYSMQILLITAAMLMILSLMDPTAEIGLTVDRILLTISGAGLSAFIYTAGLLLIKWSHKLQSKAVV